jgi:hypothetical protein
MALFGRKPEQGPAWPQVWTQMSDDLSRFGMNIVGVEKGPWGLEVYFGHPMPADTKQRIIAAEKTRGEQPLEELLSNHDRAILRAVQERRPHDAENVVALLDSFYADRQTPTVERMNFGHFPHATGPMIINVPEGQEGQLVELGRHIAGLDQLQLSAHQAPPPRSRPDLDRLSPAQQTRFRREQFFVDHVADNIGTPIDEPVKDLVASLRLLGFPTRQSCGGHQPGDESLGVEPWVDFRADSPMEAMEQKQRLGKLLDEYYAERAVPFQERFSVTPGWDNDGLFAMDMPATQMRQVREPLGAPKQNIWVAGADGIDSPAARQASNVARHQQDLEDLTAFLETKLLNPANWAPVREHSFTGQGAPILDAAREQVHELDQTYGSWWLRPDASGRWLLETEDAEMPVTLAGNRLVVHEGHQRTAPAQAHAPGPDLGEAETVVSPPPLSPLDEAARTAEPRVVTEQELSLA